jgi:hypothetical protein
VSKWIVALGLAFLVVAGLAPAGRAAVIDTFSFSNLSSWNQNFSGFSGSFTGSVEATGFIELNDLSAFQIMGNSIILRGPNSLSNLAFFSYNTGGGASLLGFIDMFPSVAINAPLAVCSGARTVLRA